MAAHLAGVPDAAHRGGLMRRRWNPKARYDEAWLELAVSVRDRDNNACACDGTACGEVHPGGRCGIPHAAKIRRELATPANWKHARDLDPADPNYGPTVSVRLAIAHLDHDEKNNAMPNLLTACSRCHIRLDRDQHRETRAARDRMFKATVVSRRG